MNMVEQAGRGRPAADEQLVFIVDDEAMIGEVVQAILRTGGYNPRFFQDPEVALRTIEEAEQKPVLLLTDYVMSPMNGLELIDRCKESQPELRTILYTGHDCDEIQSCAVQPDALLRKPFAPKALLDLVRSVLQGV